VRPTAVPAPNSRRRCPHAAIDLPLVMFGSLDQSSRTILLPPFSYCPRTGGAIQFSRKSEPHGESPERVAEFEVEILAFTDTTSRDRVL
jgi:hypothetical protein